MHFCQTNAHELLQVRFCTSDIEGVTRPIAAHLALP